MIFRFAQALEQVPGTFNWYFQFHITGNFAHFTPIRSSSHRHEALLRHLLRMLKVGDQITHLLREHGEK